MLDVGRLVTRQCQETAAVRAHSLVLARFELDLPGAARIAALAHEADRRNGERGAGAELLDPLVYLTQQDLVPADPLAALVQLRLDRSLSRIVLLGHTRGHTLL